ncbi:1-deoxy-D-xylulose-5-phosphate synthase [Clostridia bacterium]|nr:1-deoxy-D-xylulose-5-phosphate synthase [Clostridia bacterium]
MRDTFIKELTALAKADRNIVLICGDLGFGVLKHYYEALPNQFLNAGIAEQNLLGVAAGMALEGKTVFVYSIANFPTLRCLEQIRNDCAYHRANVKVVTVGGGYAYGSLGMSHHATEDISILRAIPNMTVICPGDSVEANIAAHTAVETNGSVYIRLGRGGEGVVHESDAALDLSAFILVGEAPEGMWDAAVLSTGAILGECVKSCEILRARGVRVAQFSVPRVKPTNISAIREIANRTALIITVEENNIVGGFGSAVLETLCDCTMQIPKVVRLGIPDRFAENVGDQYALRCCVGLDAESIARRICQTLSWSQL